jgi:uncharacterized protein involved in type VI secretion and phage assembly
MRLFWGSGMTGLPSFATPALWLAGAHLAKVISTRDPDQKGRVQIQILAADSDGLALIWARVAVPFAGNNYGAYLIPGVGEEVLVVFTGNDMQYPVIIGALWNGMQDVSEEANGIDIDRWTITGRNGTRIAIIEQSPGSELVEIETPAGATATLTDTNGGEIKLSVNGNSVTLGGASISVETPGEFSVDAAAISMSAGSVTVTAGSSDFSGSISCASITTSSVVSASYTPGAGNIW